MKGICGSRVPAAYLSFTKSWKGILNQQSIPSFWNLARRTAHSLPLHHMA